MVTTQAAYNEVCATVEKTLVLKGWGVDQMTDLLQEYVPHLHESPFPQFEVQIRKTQSKTDEKIPLAGVICQADKDRKASVSPGVQLT